MGSKRQTDEHQCSLKVHLLSFRWSVTSYLSCPFSPPKSSWLLLCCPRWISSTLYSSTSLSTYWTNFKELRIMPRTVDHAASLPRHPHWLPVPAAIDYKIVTLCYHCLHGLVPGYLSELLTPDHPSRLLRSVGAALVCVPRIRQEMIDRQSFSFVRYFLSISL